jgi:hypothetical protein
MRGRKMEVKKVFILIARQFPDEKEWKKEIVGYVEATNIENAAEILGRNIEKMGQASQSAWLERKEEYEPYYILQELGELTQIPRLVGTGNTQSLKPL